MTTSPRLGAREQTGSQAHRRPRIPVASRAYAVRSPIQPNGWRLWAHSSAMQCVSPADLLRERRGQVPEFRPSGRRCREGCPGYRRRLGAAARGERKRGGQCGHTEPAHAPNLRPVRRPHRAARPGQAVRKARRPARAAGSRVTPNRRTSFRLTCRGPPPAAARNGR